MSYLRRIATGAVSQNIDSESELYQKLSSFRESDGTPAFEEVGSQQLSGVTSRFIAIDEPGATIAADEAAVSNRELTGRGGTITLAEFFANENITGVSTNSRTIVLQQPGVTGTSSPVRAVTALATLALTTGVNATKGQPATMTINQAAFVGDNPLEVVSTHIGTGLADPGGIVLATYTPA